MLRRMSNRRAPGQIRDAILDYLSTLKGKDASVAEVYSAVQSSLGDDVPRSSVRSYLRIGNGIESTGHGRYRTARK